MTKDNKLYNTSKIPFSGNYNKEDAYKAYRLYYTKMKEI